FNAQAYAANNAVLHALQRFSIDHLSCCICSYYLLEHFEVSLEVVDDSADMNLTLQTVFTNVVLSSASRTALRSDD
ncbi:hypothetical protein FRC02_006450, partial [Tulasnella sp. 418]